MALPIAINNTATAFADGEFTVVAGSPASLFITGTNTVANNIQRDGTTRP